ncbi:hypothetical protein QJQ45_029333 [Haematococcus lacustris]|nr:hypothetical protein QJQ45_029333 [Haematococcus lacustris]
MRLYYRMLDVMRISASSELQATNLDKTHVADLIEEADKHHRLLGMKKQGSLQDTLPLPCRMRHAVHVCRWLEQWQQPPTPPVPGQPKRGKCRGGPWTLTCPPPFTLNPIARVGLHFIKLDSKVLHGLRNKAFQLERTVETDDVSEVYLDPKGARERLRLHGAQDRVLEQFFKKVRMGVHGREVKGLRANHVMTKMKRKGSAKQKKGLPKKPKAPIKPPLQHLAAASSAGTSLEANLKHITVSLATSDALEEDMAEVSMERHGRAKQLVVFFGAASIGTGGGWGADAVLRACCKVVCRPRGSDQLRGRVVLVDEHRTTRVSSAVIGRQPCEEELDHEQHTAPADLAPRKPPQAPCSSQEATQPAASEPGPSTPPPAKRSKRTKAEPEAAEPTQPTKGRGKAKGKAAEASTTARQQGTLPAKGKEYLGLGCKRLRDKPPKAQQQQQQQQQGALPAKGEEYPQHVYKRSVEPTEARPCSSSPDL